MDITLDKEMVKSVVSAAILQMLDAQKREALIKEAIQHLLSPGTDSWNRGRSPLQEAFANACRLIAVEIAKEMLEKDEQVKARIRELILEAYMRVTEQNREKTVQRIAEALERGMAYREER